jgi:uncharacterized coiled-coil protein SlyX
MSYEFDSEREYETKPARDIGALGSSRRTAIVIYIVLALIGSSAAFLWGEYGGTLDDFAIFKSEAAPQAVSSKVFDEYQQAVAANLRRYSGMLEAQDAEIRRLSDQVLHLTMKLDSLESSARDAQAAISPAPKAASKKPAAKPRISPGSDAPLPPASEEKQ